MHAFGARAADVGCAIIVSVQYSEVKVVWSCEYHMTEQVSSSSKRPLGISLLALLMFLVGGIWLLRLLASPLLGGSLAPWYIYLGEAAYFLVVGWGLWGARRWAYLAALLMCVVLGFYQLRTAVFLQQDVSLQVLTLLMIFGYLIRPRVRAVFLKPAEERPPINDQR
jgi:hypothetical protein